MKLDKSIFRMYDIRGIADKNLSEEVSNSIGKAYAELIKGKADGEEITVVVGRDVRLSSNRLANAFIEGVTSSGINVFDLGLCPTPFMYFSLFILPVHGGAMITGSHNPPEFNGIKLSAGREMICCEEMQKLYEIAANPEANSSYRKGWIKSFDIASEYRKFMLDNFGGDFSLSVPLKVVIDSGNGCAGPIVPDLLRQLSVEVVDLFSEPDGNFPNHHPDPTLIYTLDHLKNTVKREHADIGIAYDGDVDRIGVLDNKGEVIFGDRLTYIFAKDILNKKPGAKIIIEVKSSKAVIDGIQKLGGIPVISPVGHSIIKKKLREENALLAGEMSGHIFFNDRYFGYDDAIYATLRLIKIFGEEKSKNSNFKFSDLTKELPDVYASQEIRIDCKEEEKFTMVEQFLEKYQEKFPTLADKIQNVITIDGVRIEFPDGWGLIRASNTQPVLVMRFEADSGEKLKEYQKSFEETIRLLGKEVK